MFNDRSSAAMLLATRRSGKARDMVGPGPNAGQLRQILEAAIRVPDHGKLAPWRFVVVSPDQRTSLSDLLTSAYVSEKPDAGRLEIEAMAQFGHQAPVLVVALSAPVEGSKIPVWEQELSVGAACMNLLTAAHTQGFVANWLTGWPSYNEQVRDSFGNASQRIAGFIFIGTPVRSLEERPRPDYDSVVTHWQG